MYFKIGQLSEGNVQLAVLLAGQSQILVTAPNEKKYIKSKILPLYWTEFSKALFLIYLKVLIYIYIYINTYAVYNEIF